MCVCVCVCVCVHCSPHPSTDTYVRSHFALQVKLDQFGNDIFLVDSCSASRTTATNGLEETIATIVQHFQRGTLFDNLKHVIGGIG